MGTSTTSGARQASASPGLNLHPPTPPVTRISRRTVMLTAMLAAGLGAMVLVLGLSGHGGSGRGTGDQDGAPRPNGPVENVRDLPKDYGFDVRQAASNITYELTIPAGDAPRPGPAAATRAAGPSADELAAAEERRRLLELRRRLMEEQQKELERAYDSPLVFAGAKASKLAPAAASAPRQGTGGSSDQPEPSPPEGGPSVPAPASAMLALGPPVPAPNALIPPGVRQNLQREKEEFLTKASQVEPYLKKPLAPPVSPYELKAGTLIPGALVTAINTDLPGEIIGQVTENVYDTRTGKYLLVPQGARLLGKYSSLVANGQNRALVVWTRLILPNGNAIVLDGMPGADGAGQAGLKDKVDYHMDKIAGAVGLTTTIAYAGNQARSRNGNTGGGANNNQDVIGDTVAQQANRVGEKFIDRELDVQPTITIRAGWKFNVLVNKDVVLAPYVDGQDRHTPQE
jgi:type IV secretory pathway VirB10-like protein